MIVFVEHGMPCSYGIIYMNVAEVQFSPWDKSYWFDPAGLRLEIGDKVVVHTELGVDIGTIIGFQEIDRGDEKKDKEIKTISRKANFSDLEKIQKKNQQKAEALKIAKKLIDKHKLNMKLVDAHFSFDGGRITFAFIADGRVDFRELVKDLTHKFQKSIRLHQLGVRDEAKMVGEFGPCGIPLCCRNFLNNLGQVSSEFVETQQIAHRGGERLTGMCGRLKCCLRFEQDLYVELAKKLPPVGSNVKTDQGRGVITAQNILKQTVKVKLEGEDGLEIEVPIKNKE